MRIRISLFLVFLGLLTAPEVEARDYPPREGIWVTATCTGQEFDSADAALSGAKGCAADEINNSPQRRNYVGSNEEYLSCLSTWNDPVTQQTYCVTERWRITLSGEYSPTGNDPWYPSNQTRDVTLTWLRPCEGNECDPVCTEEQGLPRYVYPHHKPGQSQPAYCYQGCVYTKVGYAVCSSFGDDPIDSCTSKAMLMEGQECTGGDYEPAAPDNCAVMKGKVICMDQPKNNCSIIGNEAVCPGTAAPDRCTMLSEGGMLCYADAPNQPTTPDGSEQADPDGQVITNNGDILNYYSSETVNNSGTPTYGDWTGGDGGGDGDGDGLEGVAQEDTLRGVLDALTPGDGDNVGTDTGVIAEWLGETAIADIEAAVQREETIPGLSSSFLPSLPAGGACQKVSGTALGISFEFPSNTGCVYLGYLKEILAWALYILTIVYIWSIVMRRKED